MVEPGEIIGIFPGLCRWIKEKRPLSCYRTKTALIDFTIFSLLGSRIMCLTSLRIFRGILVETATKWSLPGRVMDNLIASWKSLSNGNNRSTNSPIKHLYEYPVKDEGSQSMTTLVYFFGTTNLYPVPITVLIYCGCRGSGSSLLRRRQIVFSTVLEPKCCSVSQAEA